MSRRYIATCNRVYLELLEHSRRRHLAVGSLRTTVPRCRFPLCAGDSAYPEPDTSSPGTGDDLFVHHILDLRNGKHT